MNCADFEIQLSDYIDGTLPESGRRAFELHLASCRECTELFADAKAAVEFIAKVDTVTVPPDLVTRIVYQAPLRRVRQPYERVGFFNKLWQRLTHPVAEPRFAMGMAMTLLSFAMLGRCTGVSVQQIKPADLNPVKVINNLEDKVVRTKERAVKYYEDLRLVYEIDTRLREIRQKEESEPEQKRTTTNPATDNKGTQRQ